MITTASPEFVRTGGSGWLLANTITSPTVTCIAWSACRR